MKRIAMIVVICLSGCEPQKTVSAPIEACHLQQTGNVRDSTYPLQSCASYDSNMNCTVPITTWQTDTQYEVRVTCDWL